MHRRRVLATGLGAALLAACGGAADDDGDGGSTHLRLINATADIDSIDMTADGDASDETRSFSAVLRDAQSDFVSLASGTYTLRAKRAGTSPALAINAHILDKNKRYTAFVFGREGDYRLQALVEDQAEPAAGKALLRVFNAAPDAGNVDVYLTESTTSLDDAVPSASNVAAATLSLYAQADRGVWRLRVTGRGDPRDVRLDVAAFELADKARTTIVLQPGRGGVLVHALMSQHQGALAAVKNTQARVRLAAGAAGNAAVSANMGGVSLNVNLRSPSIGGYVLVPAGLMNVAVTVGGVAAPGGARNLTAGGDHTLVVFGSATAPDWRLVPDRNQLPIQADRARLRLLHMALDVDGDITLSKDFVAVASDWFLANPVIYAPVDAGAAVRLEASSPLFADPLFLSENTAIAGRGVYTLFAMTGATRPVGILRRER
jgi:Domain of unknown function (DUF4397)